MAKKHALRDVELTGTITMTRLRGRKSAFHVLNVCSNRGKDMGAIILGFRREYDAMRRRRGRVIVTIRFARGRAGRSLAGRREVERSRVRQS